MSSVMIGGCSPSRIESALWREFQFRHAHLRLTVVVKRSGHLWRYADASMQCTWYGSADSHKE
jgi:hypothetical protein